MQAPAPAPSPPGGADPTAHGRLYLPQGPLRWWGCISTSGEQGLARWRPSHRHPTNPPSRLPKPCTRTAAQQLGAEPLAPSSPFEALNQGSLMAASPARSWPPIPARCHDACPSRLGRTSLLVACTSPGKHLPLLSSPGLRGRKGDRAAESLSLGLPFLVWKPHRLGLEDSGPLGSEMNPSSNSLNLRDRMRPPWGRGGLHKDLHGSGESSTSSSPDPRPWRGEGDTFPRGCLGAEPKPGGAPEGPCWAELPEAPGRTRGCPCPGTPLSKRGLSASPDRLLLRRGGGCPAASPSLRTGEQQPRCHLQHRSRCPLPGHGPASPSPAGSTGSGLRSLLVPTRGRQS